MYPRVIAALLCVMMLLCLACGCAAGADSEALIQEKEDRPMKEIIHSDKAPAAIGPYSHAVAIEGMVFTSGQLGIDPETGKLKEGVEAQAEQALINLENVLLSAGASMQDVVKTTVFVTDMKDFPAVNAVYAAHFGNDYPARSCVQVAALPAGGEVEIEAIAFKSADEIYNF